MSVYINASNFQQLAGCNAVVSMCDLVAALRLINDNIDYLSNFPADQISIDMKNHLIEDRECILKQAQHNITSRKPHDPASVVEEPAEKSDEASDKSTEEKKE